MTYTEELEEEIEQLRMQLAACSVAAGANTRKTHATLYKTAERYKSDALDLVLKAVEREMTLREKVEQLEKEIKELPRELGDG